MNKRHAAELRSSIDRLAINGSVKISKDMLRYWYGQERMSKTIWRDVADKLEEWEMQDVVVFEWNDDIILLQEWTNGSGQTFPASLEKIK